MQLNRIRTSNLPRPLVDADAAECLMVKRVLAWCSREFIRNVEDFREGPISCRERCRDLGCHCVRSRNLNWAFDGRIQ